MNILVAIPQYAMCPGSRIYSVDYYNFYLGLKALAEKIELFDYYSMRNELGREGMNKAFLSRVKEQKPDVVFIVLLADEFMPEILDEIKKQTLFLGYFHDDKWRRDYVVRCAKHFSYVLCTDPDAEKSFRSLGVNNALSFPQACNHNVYKSGHVEKNIDVSFVGAYHPNRAWLIERIRKVGIDVKVYGPGWSQSKIFSALQCKVRAKLGMSSGEKNDNILSFEDMMSVFRRSKISLNLSNCTNWDARYLLSTPLAYWNTRRSKKYRDGIKLRGFEISACGGFQLCYYEEGLERYYIIGEEVAIFINPDDLIDKVKYYLKNDDERESIAEKGYMRTLAEHTIEKRFESTFNKIDVSKLALEK